MHGSSGKAAVVVDPTKPLVGVHRYREPIVAGVNLFAGAVGGGFSVLLCQPLDTIKVKMQTYPELYSNLFDCGVKTWKRQGIVGLYAGTVPSLAANVLENASLFMFYGMCQTVVQAVVSKPRVEDLTTFQNACAGGAAAFFTSFFLCPTELIKCQLQAMDEGRQIRMAANPTAATEAKIGSAKLIRNILKQEGLLGMFRGLSSTLIREMPGYFFFFGGYDFARRVLTKPGQSKDDIGSVKTVLCGGFAGVTCWAAVFPADVVKSRIQTGKSTAGFWKCLTTIARTEGVLALYNGLMPTLLRTFPASGSLFLAYELTKSSLETLIFHP
ncbi:Mitochondrial ornithine transporter 1 [Hypsibius exemplaris]|uniref:Mitochondrial ornithine transporter 1 n=1 Tax=Hypsibius exemplaris TaxID=2072580 RepID=A0A1W0WGK9_HYPEX|nr:Mitochondrial ornithine transporter 1 [Hypsibius exemplaris]